MCYNELPQHVQAHQIGVDILDRAKCFPGRVPAQMAQLP